MADNTTAIAYLNNMGGIKSRMCNELAQLIWDICIKNGSWISAAHIPGVENTIADKKSREFESSCEWELPIEDFKSLAI